MSSFRATAEELRGLSECHEVPEETRDHDNLRELITELNMEYNIIENLACLRDWLVICHDVGRGSE